jgi:hypothetical protein
MPLLRIVLGLFLAACGNALPLAGVTLTPAARMPDLRAAVQHGHGPHVVGFRFVSEVDYSRNAEPWLDAGDRAVAGGTQLEIGVWYPAAGPSDTPMSAAGYRSLLGAIDLETGAEGWRRTAARAGIALTPVEAMDTLRRPTRAFRDASPTPRSHPLIVEGGFFSGTWLLNEYLASHGYVVVMITNSGRTASLQSARPAIALDTHVRNLEYATAFAHRHGLGDPSRLAVLGVNFDGMPALIYEMRNRRAKAVVSVDGIEAKVATSIAGRASAYFAPASMRVPYLIFVQDDRNVPPELAHDRTVWNALTYSTRYWFVLKGFNHVHLISDLGHSAPLPGDLRDAYGFFFDTVRRFLDAYVKDDGAMRVILETEPPGTHAPGTLIRTAERVIGRSSD